MAAKDEAWVVLAMDGSAWQYALRPAERQLRCYWTRGRRRGVALHGPDVQCEDSNASNSAMTLDRPGAASLRCLHPWCKSPRSRNVGDILRNCVIRKLAWVRELPTASTCLRSSGEIFPA